MSAIGNIKNIFNSGMSTLHTQQGNFGKKAASVHGAVASAWVSLKATFQKALSSLKHYSIKVLSTVFYPVITIYHLWHQKKPQVIPPINTPVNAGPVVAGIAPQAAPVKIILDPAQFTATSCLKKTIQELAWYDANSTFPMRSTGKLDANALEESSFLRDKYFITHKPWFALGKNVEALQKSIQSSGNTIAGYSKDKKPLEGLSRYQKDQQLWLQGQIDRETKELQGNQAKLVQAQGELKKLEVQVQDLLQLEPSLATPIQEDSIEEAESLKTLKGYQKPPQPVCVKDHILAICFGKNEKGIDVEMFKACLGAQDLLKAVLIAISETPDQQTQKELLRELGQCFVVMHPCYVVRHLQLLERKLSPKGDFEHQVSTLIEDLKHRSLEKAIDEYNKKMQGEPEYFTKDRCYNLRDFFDLKSAMMLAGKAKLHTDHLTGMYLSPDWNKVFSIGPGIRINVREQLTVQEAIRRFIVEVNSDKDTFIDKKEFLAWCKAHGINQGLLYDKAAKYPDYFPLPIHQDQIEGKMPYINEEAALQVFLKLNYLIKYPKKP